MFKAEEELEFAFPFRQSENFISLLYEENHRRKKKSMRHKFHHQWNGSPITTW